MRALRFSTLILTLVVSLLIATSAILLTAAHLGSEQALQKQIQLAYQRDQLTLNALLEARFMNIRQVSQELTLHPELRLGLATGDTTQIRRVINGLLADSLGQHIDALVVTGQDGLSVIANNVSLLGLQLPLEQIGQRYSPLASWTSIHTDHDTQHYSLLRLSLPVIDERLGEVAGKLHTFVLLNNNYWIINQLQQLFGSDAIALSHGNQLLDGLEKTPGQLQSLHTAPSIASGILTTGHSILRDHYLRIGSSDYYSVRSLLPNSAYLALQDAYVANLFYATLLVLILGGATMLALQYLIRSSLRQLTRYAEHIPESGSPQPFMGGRFQEFIRVGLAIEKMLQRIRERDKHLASIIDNSPGLIFIKDLEHRYRLVNKRLAEILNLRPEQLVGRRDRTVLSDELMAPVLQSDQRLLNDLEPIQYEMAIETQRGPRRFLVSKFPIVDDQERAYAIGGIATDITDFKQAEEQLLLAQQVIAETAEAIIVLDDRQQVLSSNPAFTEISGFAPGEATGAIQRFLEAHPNVLPQLPQTNRWQGECTLERRNGESLPVLVSITVLPQSDGQQRYVLLLSDITDLKTAEQQLERLARYDNLTGLPNRSLFFQRLAEALSGASLERTAVMFIDLDRFKSINDTYGHPLGDELLHQVAERLRRCVQIKDTVARLGGDEFTIILQEVCNRSQIESVAQRILKALSEPYALSAANCSSSVSIGIALAGKDGTDADTLTRHADLAMYQAKEQGRNQIQFFDAGISERHQRRHHYEEGLRQALDNSELFVQYQPRFDIAGRQVLGAEALVRWRHPEHGQVPPGEFIPIAEESCLIVDIGRFVLGEACRQAAAWNGAGYHFPVSVNLSPRQLLAPDLIRDIEAALKHSGLPPQQLELEITETQVMENIDQFLPVLERIRALGVSLSVDDFGTGYSSLMYLKKLPIDTVKIDRSFILDVPGDKDDEILVRAIIRMSHSLNLRVVAEGVETEQQRQFLHGLGCDQLQGYLFGRPDSADRLKVLADQAASRLQLAEES